MSKKRRKFSAEFKLKVVLESLKERSTMTELCQKHELHANQVSKWKKDFLENAKSFLGPAKGQEVNVGEEEKEMLYSKIGKLQMENEILKKKLGR